MKRKRMAVRIVPARQAKNTFGEVIRRVYEDDEIQVIERSGIPVAAIVSIADLEQLSPESIKKIPRLEQSAKRQRAWDKLVKVLDENIKDGEKFSEEEVDADVLRAVQEVRYGTGKK